MTFRLGVYPVMIRRALFFLLAAATLATAQQTPSPPGRLIDLGGYKVHIDCTGHGDPAVILLHGFGDYSFDWALVQPKLAAHTTTCSYDRPGQAWSDPGPAPRGLRTSAGELHALLQRARVKPPYVLVGHSWGGLIARMYAHLYPREIAGMVLVDSTHEDEYLWFNGKVIRPRFLSDDEWADLTKPRPRPEPNAAPTDTTKAVTPPPPRITTLDPPFDKLPPDVQKLQLWAMSLPFSKARFEGGDSVDMRQDFLGMYEIDTESKHPRNQVPLIVLSKSPGLDNDDDYTPEQLAWNRDLQRHLTALSTNSRHVVVERSGHHIQLDQPDAVVSAVLHVLDAAKHHRHLN